MSHTDQPGADPHVYAAWSKGSDFEINFWNEWIRTKGLDWPDDFRNRLSPESPFPPHLRDLISAPDGATINVLDVGSGRSPRSDAGGTTGASRSRRSMSSPTNTTG